MLNAGSDAFERITGMTGKGAKRPREGKVVDDTPLRVFSAAAKKARGTLHSEEVDGQVLIDHSRCLDSVDATPAC